MQCIEGLPATIEALWQSLLRDGRHHQIECLQRGAQPNRRFAAWTMAFSSYAHFNSYNMPGFFPVDAQGGSEAAQLCSMA